MELNMEYDYKRFLMLVCLFKLCYDSGIKTFQSEFYSDSVVNEHDYYYEYLMELNQHAAPIVKYDENLFRKHGLSPDDGDVYVFAYSSKEMQKYYKMADKLNRLEGNSKKRNPYIIEIERKMENIRGFDSYSFDYLVGNKQKGAQIETLSWYDFDEDAALYMWIIRVMRMIKEELPKLQEKYRKVRRQKRIERNCMRKGGVLCAA